MSILSARTTTPKLIHVLPLIKAEPVIAIDVYRRFDRVKFSHATSPAFPKDNKYGKAGNLDLQPSCINGIISQINDEIILSIKYNMSNM